MTGYAAGRSTRHRRRPSPVTLVAEGIRGRRALRARLAASVGLGAIAALSSLGQAFAATAYTDPVGDALFHAPPYADIVAGAVDENAGIFEFTLTVAGPIPETPRLTPPGVRALRWVVSLDLDPVTSPAGWPFAPGDPRSAQRGAAEGFVAVAWDGTRFSATLFDRRPLLTGGQVVATSVPFEIDGDTVRIWLDGSLIGHPTSFRVGFVTAALTTQLGTVVDIKQLLDVLEPFYNPWP
jgi:hypothetical protein